MKKRQSIKDTKYVFNYADFMREKGDDFGTRQRVGRRARVQAPAGDPDRPGLGDVTHHQRRVTRDSDSIGHVHEGCVKRTLHVC